MRTLNHLRLHLRLLLLKTKKFLNQRLFLRLLKVRLERLLELTLTHLIEVLILQLVLSHVLWIELALRYLSLWILELILR